MNTIDSIIKKEHTEALEINCNTLNFSDQKFTKYQQMSVQYGL